MALVWFREHNDSRYEVRSAGNTLRLYTDGVFHSQYNPTQPLTSGVWDLLMIPAFFHDPSQIKRVLVLGVGGGAVIRQLQHFVGPKEIVGVDLDPVHLEVAEKFFGVDPQNVELHCADAREWLRHYRGRKFDMIIDDLFFEQDGEPTRAIEMTRGWANKLTRHLSKQGVLVSNFVDPDHLNNSATVLDPEVTRHFQSAFRLSISRYMNSVGVFLREFSSTQQLRDNLKKCSGLDPSKSSSRLQYTIRTLY